MPYFYLIQHRDSGKRYAGVRYARGCDPSDLLVTYFTSSRQVKRLLAADPACFQIIKTKTFDDREDAISYEVDFIKRNNAHLSNEWFNQAAARAINPEAVKKACLEKYGVENWTQTEEYRKSGLGFQRGNTYGRFQRSEETRRRISAAFTGRVFSEEHRRKISERRAGSRASEQTRRKMSRARRSKPRPASFSEKMSILMRGENNPMYGRVSPRRGVQDPAIACEHCGVEANKGNYRRWHGDNCRRKPAIA